MFILTDILIWSWNTYMKKVVINNFRGGFCYELNTL